MKPNTDAARADLSLDSASLTDEQMLPMREFCHTPTGERIHEMHGAGLFTWAIVYRLMHAFAAEQTAEIRAEVERLRAMVEDAGVLCGNCKKPYQDHSIISPYQCNSQSWSNWYQFRRSEGK